MATKKKQLGKGILVNRLAVSRDGALAAGHTSPGQGGNELVVVEVDTGVERRVTLPAPFTRIAAASFIGAELVVAALSESDAHDEMPWSVLLIDGQGAVKRSVKVGKGTVSGALAVGPEGQVAVVVSTTLFTWAPGALEAGKAPRVVRNLPVAGNRSGHVAWTDEGELLLLDWDKLLEFSPAMKQRAVPLAGIQAYEPLSCAGGAVAFLGSEEAKPGHADAMCFVVDRKKGTVLSTHQSMFDGAQLTSAGLAGASGGLGWLKKKGWKTATRSVPLEKGFVMRCALDGKPKDTVPMTLPRVDSFATARGVALIGSPKGLTWLPGVFPSS